MPDNSPQPASGLRTLRVTDKTTVAAGVCALTLQLPDGDRLPEWAPGAHIDLVLPGGLTRQYSLCGDRWDAHRYKVAVLREPDGRGGSAYVHDTLAVGDEVVIGGPRNNFHLAPATRYLFIAGGIGITPILPMLHAASAAGVPWTLLYGGRTRETMAFVDGLTSDLGGEVRIWPKDEFGHLDLDGAVAGQPAGTKVYCCGPAPLLAAVETACADLPDGHLRIERFVPKDNPPPVRSEPFEVELHRTGTVVTVSPEVTVLEALREAGVPVLSSCAQGTCGTCETPVLAGIPDHRDSLLTDAERRANRSMFVCVSRSCGDRLVLDA